MSKRDGCAQACCRVPMDGVCARQRTCPCHTRDNMADLIEAHNSRTHAIKRETDARHKRIERADRELRGGE